MVTFRDPETTSLKTSFQELISLRTATGSSHLQASGFDLGHIHAKQKEPDIAGSFCLVRMKGLEPSRLAALVPKTSVSTIPPHPRGINLYFTLFDGKILVLRLRNFFST